MEADIPPTNERRASLNAFNVRATFAWNVDDDDEVASCSLSPSGNPSGQHQQDCRQQSHSDHHGDPLLGAS
jgi:hypothetical protein